MKMSVGEEVSLNKTQFDHFTYNPVVMFIVFLTHLQLSQGTHLVKEEYN